MKVFIVQDYSDKVHRVFDNLEKALEWIKQQDAPPYTFDWIEIEVN